MPVYDRFGNELTSVFDRHGALLNKAYDRQGNQLLRNDPIGSLTVMTYNIQWFTELNSNRTMQSEIFATYDADIIGFQEFHKNSSTIPQIAQDLLSADYPYIAMGDYGNYNALASKYALSDFATVPHTDQTMDGQSYSTANIDLNGVEILLVVSHLTTSSYETQKVTQAKEVFEALQGHDRFILMGDFNTVCESVNDTEYRTIMKQFIDAGYHSANCSAQHGFIDTWTSGSTASGTWYPCDHVITSANITIDNVIADTLKIETASTTGQSIDHLPLIAELTVY